MTNFFKDLSIMLFMLIASFTISLGMQNIFKTDTLIPTLFLLSVFIVALLTRGYFFGIVYSLICVLAVNFAFIFPFFEFNFTISENAISAVIMILITSVTSALTTRIKQLECKKQESEKEKMRANLLRAISHDLSTPLTSIYGASSTMLENEVALTPQDKRDMLLGIKEDSQWLIRMVENLLSVTKIDSYSVKLIKSPVVLEELIDSVLSKFKKRYPSQKVKLYLPESFTSVSADPLLIEQVLMNLLENAVEHATGMTELSLCVYLENHKAIFEITDNGCGVGKERIKSIFSYSPIPDNKSSDNKQGMGIGLGVCSTIIKAHGGSISAENLKPRGMKFTFSLDLEDSYE